MANEMPTEPADAYYDRMTSVWAGQYPSTETVEDYEAFQAEMGADRSIANIVETLMGHVPLHQGRVLEFGCDNGVLLNFFDGQRLERFGVDINPASIARGQKLFPGLDLRVSSGVSVPFEDDFFDVVVVSAVLKHIRPEERPALYREFRRVARHVMAFHEETAAPSREVFGGFVFYRADFTRELGGVFERVHELRTAGHVYEVYRT